MNKYNENNEEKIFLRFLKEKGIYTDFIHFLKNQFYVKNLKQLQEKCTFNNVYSFYANQNNYNNDYTVYLTKIIGVENSMNIFKDFIEKNYGKEIYKQYLKNISEKFINENVVGNNVTLVREDGIRTLPFISYLYYAFYWEETPQGHEFWNRINDKWLGEGKKIIIQNLS